MTDKTLFRLGGLAALVGVVLLLAAYSISTLLSVALLSTAVYYFALHRSQGPAAAPLGLAAMASVVLGAIGILLTGAEPTVIYNIFMLLGMMLPPLLAGLAYRGKADFPGWLALVGILTGILGTLNAIINISGGGDWTKLPNPTLTNLSNLTYYPAALLLLAWLVYGGIRLFRKA